MNDEDMKRDFNLLTALFATGVAIAVSLLLAPFATRFGLWVAWRCSVDGCHLNLPGLAAGTLAALTVSATAGALLWHLFYALFSYDTTEE
jgi:hypothetical protein